MNKMGTDKDNYLICIRCKSNNVIMIDDNIAKCNDCGYTLSVEVNNAGPVTFKSGEPHFDSRKYTCDPSWTKYWEKSQPAKGGSLISKIKNFFKHKNK